MHLSLDEEKTELHKFLTQQAIGFVQFIFKKIIIINYQCYNGEI